MEEVLRLCDRVVVLRRGRVAATLGRSSEKQDLSLAMWAEPKVLQRSERGQFREFNRFGQMHLKTRCERAQPICHSA